MKCIVQLSILLFFNLTFSQTQTLFIDKNFNDIINSSKTEKKPIVLMLYATWCTHCNKMKSEVFTDNEVIDFYNKNYICVAVNAESKEGNVLKDRFKTKFKVKSYPTFVFMDSNENLLYSMVGEYKKDKFIEEGKNALIPENYFYKVKEKFYEDVSNADNCLKYIMAIRKTGFDATSVAREYLSGKKENELFTEQNWKIFSNGINDIEAPEIQFLNNHKDDFAKVTSVSRVEKKFAYVVSDNLRTLAETLDTINYNKKKPIAESFHIRKVDSLLFRYDLQIAESANNWKKYKETALNSVDKFLLADSNLLVQIASNFQNNINDVKSNEMAIQWALKALQLSESKEKYILISKLYLKNKDKKNALDYAQKGKNFLLNSGFKTDDLDSLINNINHN